MAEKKFFKKRGGKIHAKQLERGWFIVAILSVLLMGGICILFLFSSSATEIISEKEIISMKIMECMAECIKTSNEFDKCLNECRGVDFNKKNFEKYFDKIIMDEVMGCIENNTQEKFSECISSRLDKYLLLVELSSS